MTTRSQRLFLREQRARLRAHKAADGFVAFTGMLGGYPTRPGIRLPVTNKYLRAIEPTPALAAQLAVSAEHRKRITAARDARRVRSTKHTPR